MPRLPPALLLLAALPGCGAGAAAPAAGDGGDAPDPFAGLPPGFYEHMTLNGRRYLTLPDGPVVLEVAVANLTDRPVRVPEPLVPGPTDRPRLFINIDQYESAPVLGPDGRVRSGVIWGTMYGEDDSPPPFPPVREIMTAAGRAAADAPPAETVVPPGGRIVRRFRLDRLYRLDRPLRVYSFFLNLSPADPDGASVQVRRAVHKWIPAIFNVVYPEGHGPVE